MKTMDPRDDDRDGPNVLGPEALPPNREPGTAKHPHASRPLRDLADRAAADGQEDEGSEHLYGERTLDGQAGKPHYLGNQPRGRQARRRDDPVTEEAEPVDAPRGPDEQ